MSLWPSVADYKEAIQNPPFCFARSDLQESEPAMNLRRGSPLLWEGNFAVVFKVHCRKTSDTWAVKCFHRRADGLELRYRAISDHLRKQKSHLPFAVEFQFVEDGIRVRGEWFPILKMRWVDGTALNDFVRQNLHKPSLLKKAAELIIAMGKQLEKVHVAHGDLQHGNILVVQKDEKFASIKLVDYDGMFVPALALNPPNEKGHSNFQHKDRLKNGTYSEKIDRFPFLVLYCALRCFAETGKLFWDRFDNGDNLLFKEADFASPSDSPLLKELWRMTNSKAKNLVGKLILASDDRIENTPAIWEILDQNNDVTLTTSDSNRICQILNNSGNLGTSNSGNVQELYCELYCPHCVRHVNIRVEALRKVTKCPSCSKLIIVRIDEFSEYSLGKGADALPNPQPFRARQPKPSEVIDLNCPNCASKLTFAAIMAGRLAECPKCAWHFWMPGFIPEENLRTTL